MSAYQDWLIGYLERTPTSSSPSATATRCWGFLREPLQGPLDQPAEEPPPVGHPAAVRRPVRDLRLVRRAPQLRVGARRPGRRRASERFWPHVQHLIGKDILKPHAIYWPCMLKAAGHPLLYRAPQRPRLLDARRRQDVQVASATSSRRWPSAEKYGNDAFRYFVLREMAFGLDADFSRRRWWSGSTPTSPTTSATWSRGRRR